MKRNTFSEANSAIDDLLFATAPPMVEFNDLMRHLQRCEKLTCNGDGIAEDELKTVSLVRHMFSKIRRFACEHRYWQINEQCKQSPTDDEKQEEPRTMETIQTIFQGRAQFNLIRFQIPDGMRKLIEQIRVIIHDITKVRRPDKKTSDPSYPLSDLLDITETKDIKLIKESMKSETKEKDSYLNEVERESSWPGYKRYDRKARLEMTRKSYIPYGDSQAKDFTDMDRVWEQELRDLERTLEALAVKTKRKKMAEKGHQDDKEPVGAYSDRGMAHWRGMSQNWKALLDTEEPSLTSQIFGRDGDRDYIILWLLSDATSDFSPFGDKLHTSNFSAMVIVGEAGVGKTALANLVYDDPTVKEHFSARAWVHAAEGSDAETISKAIFGSITGKSCGNREPLHLQTIIQQHVNGKRLLLVLDGFEDLHPCPWEHLRTLFSGVRTAKFLITCRRQNDAQKTQHLKFYNLHPLPPDLAWDLFFKCAFSEGPAFPRCNNLQEAAGLIEIGKQIVPKCKGLPLAVRVLGGLMGFYHSEEAWRRVLESYVWNLAKSEIFAILQLNYNCMPLNLRECFLYCSVFPKRYKLNKHELVRLWMAQKYIIHRGDKRPEDIGVAYFEKLQRMSFFVKSPDGDGTFTVHDLLYDHFKSNSGGEYAFIKCGDACTISHEVCHLCMFGGDMSTNNLTSFVGTQRLRLTSFFYKSFDGIMPEFVSSFIANFSFLRALELKLHDDSAEAPEIAQRLCSDNANVPSIKFADFIVLRYLRICDKSMESLPASLFQLRLLETLHLDKCTNLREIPNDIGNLVNLRYLGLPDARIQMLPDSVCRLLNLQSLILDRCRNLSALPNNIGSLSTLRHIGLSRTNIQVLPYSFRNLSKLPILKLVNCRQLVELPSGIGGLVDLQFLQVIETKVNILPDSVCRLSNLLKLDMAGSDLVELPDGIGNLSNLRCLVLSHTNICVLPESLCRLLSLHTLKLDGCKNLACLPSGIGDLAKLGELLLSCTNIAELPESISMLHNLQRLELDGCTRFLSLSHSIGQLTSLFHINLSDTEIAEIPASICQLTNLQTLELNGCHRLSEVPADIGNLRNLRDLQVTETQVRELPRSLCLLSNLNTLILNGNRKLQELPIGIENLTNLCHLELSQVAISVLPKQICQLSKLDKLNFEFMQKLPTDTYQ